MPPKVESPSLKCLECEKTFASNSNFTRHQKNIHGIVKTFDKLFLCEICERGFSSKWTLKRHCIEKHPKSKLAKFACSKCCASFRKKGDLNRHKEKAHGWKNSGQEASCHICDKTFCSNKSRNRHLEVVHQVEVEKETADSSSLTCPLCDKQFSSSKDINEHLTHDHSIKIEVETQEFTSFQEFESWKGSMEEEKLSHYIKSSGKKKVSEGYRRYYQCHRSGVERKKEDALRIHWKPSAKIGGYCPSSLTMTESTDGSVKVIFVKTHVGHSVELQHLHLSEAQRTMLAGMIQAHIPLDQILSDIRNSVSEETNMNRLHLTERRDLLNIIRDFNLDRGKVDVKDINSVDMWVNEQRKTDDNVVLYYKAQDSDDPSGHLRREDFMLVIMTKYQQEVLCESEQKKILIDSIDSTTDVSFLLATLLTVDDSGGSFPASFCLSNRTDQTAMIAFFTAVKLHIGDVTAEVFMSDDDPSYYNAWVDVMGPCKHRLLCTWNVDKAWREQIRLRVKSTVKAAEVYKGCRVLLEEVNIEDFEILVQDFLIRYQEDPEAADFAYYFREAYSNRGEMWGFCYRLKLGFNSDTLLYALHKKLKYIYLHDQKNHRYDNCIAALMKFCKDIMFERLIHNKKNKPTKRMLAITESHKKSLDITSQMIVKVAPNSWWVQSSAATRVPYTVSFKTDVNCSCALSCPVCKVCVHQISCECVDYLLNLNICKHVHACMKIKQAQDKEEGSVGGKMQCGTSLETSNLAENSTEVTKVHRLLDAARELIEGTAPDHMGEVLEHTEKFLNVVQKLARKKQHRHQ